MAGNLPSPAELEALLVPDPDFKASMEPVFANMPRPSIDPERDPASFIQAMRNSWKLPTVEPRTDVTQYQTTYTTQDGTSLRILVYRPAAATQPLPAFIFYHGGGMCVGVPEMNMTFCQTVALEHNIVVFAPQYRLAPEFPFPIGRNDCYDALMHIHGAASTHQADPALGLVIGGESAGAVVSATLALQARDEKLNPPITGCWFAAGGFIAASGPADEYKPYYLSATSPPCANSPMLNIKTRVAFAACQRADLASPLLRASNWPTGFQGLPRTYFHACGLDLLRDDSFVYRDMLAKQGVETRLVSYKGGPHCFWFMFGQTELGRKFYSDASNALKWLFRQEQAK